MNAGRKRTFDKQEALDTAMRVFWASGYSGTSVNDLTAALGINKPSLYAAFGNKEQLFRAAVDHYVDNYGAPHWRKLTEPEDAPFEDRLKAYLYSIVDMISSDKTPQGCLFVKSACESGDQVMSRDVRDMLHALGREHERTLANILRNEIAAGNLHPETDVKGLSTYIMSVMYGLGVLVKNGCTKRSLRSAVDVAVRASAVNT